MPTFAELLTQYMRRVGVTDSELARKIGVQRQTIFRWKEGTVGRPRVRDDVLKCADCLRLTPAERAQFLLAAGFAPEQLPVTPQGPFAPADVPVIAPEPTPTASEIVAPVSAVLSTPVVTAEVALPMAPAPALLWPRWLTLSLLIGFVLLLGSGLWLYRNWTQRVLPATPTVDPGVVTKPTAAPALIKAPKGIVVSQFSTVLAYPRYDVAKRIKEAVDVELGKTALTNTLTLIWPENISSKESAEAVLHSTGAALVIWGEYDAGRVVVQVAARNHPVDPREISVANPNDLNATINIKVKQEAQLLALLILGQTYLNDGLDDQANRAFRQALALQPQARDTQATLYFSLGYLAQNLAFQTHAAADYARAFAYYQQAIALNPLLVEGPYNLGTTYLEKSYGLAAGSVEITQSLTAAIAQLSQTIQLKPDYVNAYTNRGISYYERHQADDLQAAQRDFTKVIELAPQRYEGYYNRALVRLRANQPGWTVDLTTTLTITPTNYRALDAFCWGYALNQAPARALPFCERSVTLEEAAGPSKAGRVSRGIVYAELGRFTDALNDLMGHQAYLKSLQPATRYARLSGPQVEQWIAAVRQQKNPFDPAMLQSLR